MSGYPTCPFCGATDATFEDTERVSDTVYAEYSCECGHTFYEVFEFSHLEDGDGIVVGDDL